MNRATIRRWRNQRLYRAFFVFMHHAPEPVNRALWRRWPFFRAWWGEMDRWRKA